MSLTIPRWVWSDTLEAVVEVTGAGHYPTTVMVKAPDDKVYEVEVSTLRTQGATS